MSDISFNAAMPQVNVTVTPTGLNGRDGQNGKDGLNGRDGTDGQDGVGIVSVEIDERKHLMLTLSDGSIRDAGEIAGNGANAEQLAVLESIRAMRPNAPENRGSEPYDGAVLTFTDDDGTLRFLTEHVPVYRKHGVTATTAVVASRAITTIGTTTSGDPYEAMSFEQLRALAREGFDIQSHTWSHARSAFNPSYSPSATDAEIDLEYRLADEAFRQNGFDYNCMVFPWGAHESRHLTLARRYARYGVNCRGKDGMNDASADPMDLNRLSASTNGGNLGQLKAAIDTAIQRKCWLIILTHAGMTQPDAASLDALLTYAQEKGIRVENFREAARLKAPAYYAGQDGSAFCVMPDGRTSAKLADQSIAALIARTYELGYISPMAEAIESLSATWTGGALTEGDTLDVSKVAVTAHLHGGGTRAITDFIVEGSFTVSAGENTIPVRYGTVTGILTVTAAASANPPDTLLLEHTTLFGGASDRDRVWFARHMEAGTYALRVTLSEPMGVSTSTTSFALILKTASAFGESTGTELFKVTAADAQNKTSFDASFTLSEATDGFFFFAKLFKTDVHIQFFVNGEVTDSGLMDIAPVAALQGSAAAPGEGWFPVSLAAGTHPYKIEIGGAAEAADDPVVIKAAATQGDTTGEQLLTYTGKQCNGGLTVMDTITLTEAVAYLYIVYAPSTKSTFTVTLTML